MASTLPVSPYASKAFPAGSTSLTQFQYVVINASGQIVTPSSTGVMAWILDDSPSLSGATVTNDMPSGGFSVGAQYTCHAVHLTGYKVISGANLTAGVAVQTDTNGHAVPLVTGGVVLGYTVAASNSGDIVSIVP